MKTWKFPAGEIGVALEETDGPDYLLDDYSSDGIMRMLMFADAAKRKWGSPRILHIGYFPYGRQDRVCHHGESLSLGVMAGLVNRCSFKMVEILEPHSEVTIDLVRNLSPRYAFRWFLDKTEKKTIVAADEGARERCGSLARVHSSEPALPLVVGKKRRTDHKDLKVSFHEDEAYKIYGKDCLIFDDICDGGATFVAAAKELRSMGAKSVTLCVAHGLYTKGLSVFDGLIDEIYSLKMGIKNITVQKDK